MLASYDMCANRRMEAGEILNRAPMGYFNENRLGELTATLTTTLGEIETNAVAILDRVATGVVHAVVITIAIFWFDWRAGCITAAGLGLSLVNNMIVGVTQGYARKLEIIEIGRAHV